MPCGIIVNQTVLCESVSFVLFLVASERLGLESSGHDAGSAVALVPIILQCRFYNARTCVCVFGGWEWGWQYSQLQFLFQILYIS